MIGVDVTHTRFLRLARVTRLVEDLAATALLEPGGDLATEYELLRKASYRDVVVMHPAFEATVAILLREPKVLGPLLRLFRAEANNEACGGAVSFVLSEAGIVVLPISGVAIDCGSGNGGATVHLTFWPQAIRAAVNGQEFEVNRAQRIGTQGVHFLNGPARVRDLNIGTIRVDAWTDAYRNNVPEDWRVADMTEECVDDWCRVLDRAMRSLELCAPRQWADIKELVGIIVPVQEVSPDTHLSSSTLRLPQAVFMSWTADEMQIIEALAHEAGHHKLFLHEENEPLIVSSDPPMLRSPWRSDLRPPRGLLHGMFAFCGVLATWHSFLACSDCPASWRPRLVDKVNRLREQLSAAIREIRRHSILARLGDLVVCSAESLIATKTE